MQKQKENISLDDLFDQLRSERDEWDDDPVIKITYVWCPNYADRFEYGYDEEYSFEGDKEYFLGNWQREYGVIDFDDEIEQLEGEECKFVLYRMSPDEGLCKSCEKSDDR